MDFFAHQDRARTRSRRLVALFVLALVAVVVAVDVAAYAGWWLFAGGLKPPRFFLETNTFVTLLIVVGGAWVETHRLRDGASALAARLGARPLDDNDPLHRRLRDVTEETAIAAGVPVPALYVLDDPSINALAAGESPALAAVLVTRGALERLERAELQGVVAHEIAHIVGGDSASNAQLAGALYGLLSLHLLGSRMLASALDLQGATRSAFPVRIALAVAGLLVSAVGGLGLAAAQLLRAGISRQREFLADALAVQFTRDRDGLGGALRRIAGEKPTSLGASYAPLVAHFLLAPPGGAGDALNTHPPLAERIRRLYGRTMPAIVDRASRLAPDGSAPADSPVRSPAGSSAERPVASPMRSPGGVESAGEVPEAIDSVAAAYLETMPYVPVARSEAGPASWFATAGGTGRGAGEGGTTSPARAEVAASPAAQLVERIRAASLGYESAGRWLEALVGGADDVAREGGVESDDEADEGVRDALAWVLSPAGSALRVPLLELLLARVRRWSSAHRRDLLDRCRRAVERDGRVDSSEWVYYTLARHRLLPAPPGAQRARRAVSRAEQSRALAALFAMAAAIGEASARNTRDALADAAALLEIQPPAATPDEVGTGELTRALDVLLALPPLSKPILLKVLRRLARTPGDPNYDAFLRAVAAALDCPAPRATSAAPRSASPSLRPAIAPSVAPPNARSPGMFRRREAGADAMSV